MDHVPLVKTEFIFLTILALDFYAIAESGNAGKG